MSFVRFVKNLASQVYRVVSGSFTEIKYFVTWPQRKEVLATTIIVFIMLFLFSIFFILIDRMWVTLIEFLLRGGSFVY